mgnify:CR=1 FL=1
MRVTWLAKSGWLVIAIGFAASAVAQAYGPEEQGAKWTFDGHIKYQAIHTDIPEDSILRAIGGSALQDHNLETRLKAAARRGPWSLTLHGQLLAVHSDSLGVFRDLPAAVLPGAGVIDDRRRWLNLSHTVKNRGEQGAVVRLDRASIGYTGEKTVLRFGRQAVSWGNGLLFTPMDIFNPFDPTAVDKEYKTGDDMLYAQYLFDNGADLQTVAVVRRNAVSGQVEQDESSLAIKYHGFWGAPEFDLMVAEHYAQRVVGVGASTDFGGAVWRGDLVWTDTRSGSSTSVVAGVSYSWIAGGLNWAGLLEYHYNGFGQPDDEYGAADFLHNPELLRRLARGETFNIGRHYLGASVTVELMPLLNLTPSAFINLTDPSALAQVVLAYDWKQDIQLLGALSLPLGPGGSEYGGIDAGQPGTYFSTGPSLFLQLAWYF